MAANQLNSPETQKRQINAVDLKALVAQEMLHRFMLRSIGTEVTIPSHRSRADLVFFGRRSYGIEIKSPLDSLKRLNTQLEACSAIFDYSIVVCGENTLQKVLDSVPHDVGIWTAGEGELKFRRRPIKQNKWNLKDLFEIFSKGELVALAKMNGLAIGNCSRSEIFNSLYGGLGSRLRGALMNTLASRYIDSTERFRARISNDQVRKEDVGELSRYAVKREQVSKYRNAQSEFWARWAESLKHLDAVQLS